jgi:SH3-like domain-containing protein
MIQDGHGATSVCAFTRRRRAVQRRAMWRFFVECIAYLLVIGFLVVATPALAETSGSDAARGSVTNLPLPRYVSLKVAEGNARRGPSLSHRIDWVFVRRDMPLEITGEYEHWRRVRDRDGAGGWVHYSLLSGVRTVIVTEAMTDLRARPEPDAPVVARAEGGLVARLGPCGVDWCRISAGVHKGWTDKAGLWGVAADEIRD